MPAEFRTCHSESPRITQFHKKCRCLITLEWNQRMYHQNVLTFSKKKRGFCEEQFSFDKLVRVRFSYFQQRYTQTTEGRGQMYQYLDLKPLVHC